MCVCVSLFIGGEVVAAQIDDAEGKLSLLGHHCFIGPHQPPCIVPCIVPTESYLWYCWRLTSFCFCFCADTCLRMSSAGSRQLRCRPFHARDKCIMRATTDTTFGHNRNRLKLEPRLLRRQDVQDFKPCLMGDMPHLGTV